MASETVKPRVFTDWPFREVSLSGGQGFYPELIKASSVFGAAQTLQALQDPSPGYSPGCDRERMG